MTGQILSIVDASMFMPMVIETTSRGERGYDLFSRLLKDRIVFLGTPIDDAVANVIIGQLLFLESEDQEEPITMYINSPGGVVTAGLAIYDTMQDIRCPVHTQCVGQAASMGAVLLAAGEAGSRKALPNATIMIHQPLGGARGQATDIEIQAKEIGRLKQVLTGIIADHSGQSYDATLQAMERDNYMTALVAKEFGIIDEVNSPRKPKKPKAA